MSFERQALIWVVVVAAICYVLYALGSVITPFAAGIALGYFFNPVVHRLERLGLNRLGGSLLILFLFVVVLVIALVVAAPILSRQVIGLTLRLPDYAMRLQALVLDQGNALLAKYGGHWSESLGLGQSLSADQLQRSVGDFVTQGAQWLVGALRSLVSSGAAVVNFLSLLIITPVVAFYVLVDWNRMIATIDGWLPLDHREEMRSVAREIDLALAGFLRGQSLVCVFLGLWYGVGLTLVGLDFGFLIGILGGVLSFIPYVGSLVVFLFGLSVALVQGWPDFHLLLMTLGVVVAGQILEGYIVAPKLVGGSVGLHPVWLMFALLAFGELLGIVGLIIAVPAAAAIGVIMRRLIALYMAGPLFRGKGAMEKAQG